MKKYECSKCHREVVAPQNKDVVQLLCCAGDTPVTFNEVRGGRIVSVPALPATMTDKKPLPLSVPVPRPSVPTPLIKK
jgi:hypothetical protein